MELYKKHRPENFRDLLGQPAIAKQLAAMANKGEGIPQVILLTGPSGCGKTTTARIIKNKLECNDRDYIELDGASNRGIDTVRQIKKTANLRPSAGPVRLWVIDEAHQLTGEAQGAFLKLLEDTPKHCYFILCTTDPQKLRKAIKTRCTHFQVKALNRTNAKTLIEKTCKREKKPVPAIEVIDKLIEAGEGSPRQILVNLNAIIDIEGEEKQIEAIANSTSEEDEAFKLWLALKNPRVYWADVAKVLKAIEAEEPERVRRLILACARNDLLASRKSVRACTIIDEFRDNFFDSGNAGLAAACYRVIHMSEE